MTSKEIDVLVDSLGRATLNPINKLIDGISDDHARVVFTQLTTLEVNIDELKLALENAGNNLSFREIVTYLASLALISHSLAVSLLDYSIENGNTTIEEVRDYIVFLMEQSENV